MKKFLAMLLVMAMALSMLAGCGSKEEPAPEGPITIEFWHTRSGEHGTLLDEQIKKFTLLPEPFSMAKGELTNTLKIKRSVLNKNYAAEIEAMYAE